MSIPMTFLWLSALGQAAPTGAPAGSTKPPTFESAVAVVAVPVFVADGKGHALRGLTADDFEVYQDGQRMPVVSFQDVDTTSAREQERIRRVSTARRRFLLLFDLSFSGPAGLHRAQVAARDFVAQRLALSDLAAVATVDVNRGVRVLANFSEDRSLLRKALDAIGVPVPLHATDPLAISMMLEPDPNQAGLDRIDDIDSLTSKSPMDDVARLMRNTDRALYRRQVLAFLNSLEGLGEALRQVDGRKQVLYFSSGFDSQALVGLQGEEARGAARAVTLGSIFNVDSDAYFGDVRVRDVFSAGTRALSSADCVVHSIDVTGLGPDTTLQQDAGERGHSTSTSGLESLGVLAAETGGRLFKNSNDPGNALGEILDMTSRYYVLGYQPVKASAPGRFHKIRVKVRRGGARVSHRTGYYSSAVSRTPLEHQFRAGQMMVTGVANNTLAFEALCLPFPADDEWQSLGLAVQVPRSALRWDKDKPLALDVYAYAVAEDGTVADRVAQRMRLDQGLADPVGGTRGVVLLGGLRLRPGRYTLKLMVQDPETESTGIQFLDLNLPAPRRGLLLPPVVLEDPDRWIRVPLGSARTSPFHAGGHPLVPRIGSQVENGVPAKLALVAWGLAGNDAPVAIQSSLTDASGTPWSPGPLRVLEVHRHGARRTYILSFKPEGLPPGSYTLRLGLDEGADRLESSATLHVKPSSLPR